MLPKVAVQIITYWSVDIEQDLEDLRRSFEQVDYPRDRWRLVIIDNPSPNGRAVACLKREWLSRAGSTLPEIDLVENETNNGFAGGHMSGLPVSKAWGADYVYLLNQDGDVDPKFLSTIVARAQLEPKAAIWQSRIMLKQEPTLLNSSGNALHFLGFGYSMGYKQTVDEAALHPQPMFYASGAAALIRVSLIDRVGLFDEGYFMYHDDVDISWRARLAGQGISYVSDSIMYHRYEFSRSIKKFFWMERNRHLTNFINYKVPTLLLIAPAALVMELGTFMFAIKAGWGKGKVRSWLFFWKPSTWKWIRQRRKEVAKFRVASDREMLRHMVGVIEAQEVKSSVISYLVNPVLHVYFILLKIIVRW